MKQKTTNDEAVKRIKEAKRMKSLAIYHGAKFEAFDLGDKGIQFIISSPANPEDCMAIQLKPNDVHSLKSWLKEYYLRNG